MFITVSNEVNGQVFGPLEVHGDMTLPDLTALLELDCGFDESKHDLYYNMEKLSSQTTNTLKEIFGSENDLLLIRNKLNVVPGDSSDDAFVENFRQEMLRNQAFRSQLVAQVPGLEQAIDDPQLFRERLGPIILQRKYAMGQGPGSQGGGNFNNQQNPFGIPQSEYVRLMSDPDDPANQKRISELINLQEIEEQFHNAWEYTPEVFTSVHMLYISMEINGHPVKAFVDTGAEMTIISTKLAEEAGLTRLIDKRFMGEARGVGTSKILGRIHQAQIKIETQYIPCTFTVLDTHVDILFGLDMLKRHRAIIDLEKDVLKIAGVETKFLRESEVPKSFMENLKGISKEGAKTPLGNPQVSPGTPTPGSRAQAGLFNGVSAATSASHPESKIKQLMDLGFSRVEVIKALDQTKGNVDFAASSLFR